MTDASQYDEFICEGNEINCRQKITGSDYQNKELQSKYKNYFSSFVTQLIKLSHSK
jgi:hypothetical protein